MTKAVFTGSFDPITYGHLDIITRGLTVFDELIVGIATNHGKSGLFETAKRLRLLEETLAAELAKVDRSRVQCEVIPGLVAQYAHEIGANAILRGVRTQGEFERESSMALLNRRLAGVETVILPTTPELGVVSSSVVKEIAKFGGDLTGFVPPLVARAVIAKLGESTMNEQELV